MLRMLIIIQLIFIPLFADESLYALKGGLLSHSTGPISNGQEHGVDLHAEILWNKTLLKGHYAAGTDLSLSGETSFVYAGLSWEGRFYNNLLLGFFSGFAVHDGKLDGNRDDRRLLGARILFRGAVEVGWYLSDSLSLGVMYDHYSNLGIGDVRNQGNDNLGLRLSYYF